MAVKVTVLVFIINVTYYKSRRMNSEVFGGVILSAQIQLNALKLTGQCCIVQMHNDTKHTVKAI